MKRSLLAGVVLLVVGMITALMGMLSVGGPVPGTEGAAATQFPIGGPLWHVVVPIVSGLSLALGALLVGLSMGNWRHPRSHEEPGDEIVDPEGHHKMKHV